MTGAALLTTPASCPLPGMLGEVCADRRGPLSRQDDTPKPTNPDVYIHETPSATFFVSQYAGFGQDDITIGLKVALRLSFASLLPHTQSEPSAPPMGYLSACKVLQSASVGKEVWRTRGTGLGGSAKRLQRCVLLCHAGTAAGMLPGLRYKCRRRCPAQANALADKLTKAGENFVAGLFFTAGYDPPFRLTGA